MATAELILKSSAEEAAAPSFLIFDTESVPDGKLLRLVKYPKENLTDQEAVARAQAEARDRSNTGSDFLPVTFHVPVALSVLLVNRSFELEDIRCPGAPDYRPAELARRFWHGVERCPRAKLVTFNGRCFDLPLLEIAAFRYGLGGAKYFQSNRNRFAGNHLDLLDWLSNYGAIRISGGLNLLSKILGKPGKMEVSGDQVYAMFLEGKRQEICDYCLFDTLDTYFVFLRTRVMAGEITLEREQELVRDKAKPFLAGRVGEFPALQRYLANWGNWDPWP